MLTEALIRTIFAPWEAGDSAPFFAALPDNVSFIILGKHNPLFGKYDSKAEVLNLFGRFASKLAAPLVGKVTNVLVAGNSFVVEMAATSVTTAGTDYEMDLCWICRYENGKIVEVKFYMDSALMKKVFEE